MSVYFGKYKTLQLLSKTLLSTGSDNLVNQARVINGMDNTISETVVHRLHVALLFLILLSILSPMI